VRADDGQLAYEVPSDLIVDAHLSPPRLAGSAAASFEHDGTTFNEGDQVAWGGRPDKKRSAGRITRILRSDADDWVVEAIAGPDSLNPGKRVILTRSKVGNVLSKPEAQLPTGGVAWACRDPRGRPRRRQEHVRFGGRDPGAAQPRHRPQAGNPGRAIACAQAAESRAGAAAATGSTGAPERELAGRDRRGAVRSPRARDDPTDRREPKQAAPASSPFNA
jgi:hypothetical protein